MQYNEISIHSNKPTSKYCVKAVAFAFCLVYFRLVWSPDHQVKYPCWWRICQKFNNKIRKIHHKENMAKRLCFTTTILNKNQLRVESVRRVSSGHVYSPICKYGSSTRRRKATRNAITFCLRWESTPA